MYEQTPTGPAYNQPAGHIEANETPEQAAIRETYEETGYRVTLTGFLGTSQFLAPNQKDMYFRFSYIAAVQSHDKDATLDDGIIEPQWLTYEQIKTKTLRSPLVLSDIERYLAGINLPLNTHSVFI